MFKRSLISITTQAAIYSTLAMPITLYAEETQQTDEGSLERITVTSQKRLQSMQDIPTSIQAFSGDDLAKSNIGDLLDMSESLPNVHFSETSTSKRIFVRGIGSGTNAGFEQSVAMYKDGIYLGRGHQAKFPFLDMQRIELIKGPQSVMFGKNATAGALSMLSNDPSGDNEGQVGIEFGSDNERRFTFVGNLAVNDDFSIRLAAFTEEMDGYIKNVARDTDEVSSESSGFRLSADWQASDDLNVLFKWENGSFDTKGSRYQYIVDTANRDAQLAQNPAHAAALTLLLQDQSGLDDVNSVDSSLLPGGLDEGSETTSNNGSLKLSYNMGLGEFVSVTTYSDYDWTIDFDADYTEISFIKQQFIENYEQFTQEFRYSSPLGETLEYVAGVFYMTSEIYHPNDGLLGASALIPTLPPGTSIGTRALIEQEQESFSAFASLTWNINQDFKTTFGLRVQTEEKEVTSVQDSYAIYADATPQPVRDAVNFQVPFIAKAISGAGTHNLSESRKENHVSPSLSLQYTGIEDTMIFASASIGYKSGGFDGTGLNGTDGTTPDPESGFEFEDEKATNYEIGIKSQPIKNKLELNATAFFTIYEDLQVSEFNGNAYVVKNAAETEVKGIEIDSRLQINNNWNLSASIALLDFEYNKYSGASPTVTQAELLGMASQDLTGKTGAFAPEYSGNIALNYSTEIGSSYLLDAALSMNFTDDFYLAPDLDPISIQDGYQKLNFRIELTDANEVWNVALLGNNLTDKQTFSQANDTPIISHAHRFIAERPRSFHIQASYNF